MQPNSPDFLVLKINAQRHLESSKNPGTPFKPKEKVVFLCKNGVHSSTKESSLLSTCERNATWDPIPECEGKICQLCDTEGNIFLPWTFTTRFEVKAVTDQRLVRNRERGVEGGGGREGEGEREEERGRERKRGKGREKERKRDARLFLDTHISLSLSLSLSLSSGLYKTRFKCSNLND